LAQTVLLDVSFLQEARMTPTSPIDPRQPAKPVAKPADNGVIHGPVVRPALPARPLPPAPTPEFAALLAAGEITPQEWIGRVRLAATCRLFAALGWEEPLCTQLTMRVPGTHGAVYLVPAFGVPLGAVGVRDIVRLSLDGQALATMRGEHRDGVPPSVDVAGFHPHAAIYAVRNDVHCILRIHTPAAVAVACQGEGLRIDNAWGAQLAGRIASHDFGGIDFDDEECIRIAKDLGGREVLILRSLGFIAVGSSIENAWKTVSILERSCQAQVATESMSGANEPLTPTMARRCMETYQAMEARIVELRFDYALGRAHVKLTDVLS